MVTLKVIRTIQIPYHNTKDEFFLTLSRLIYRFSATVEGELYTGVILVKGEDDIRPDRLIRSLLKLKQYDKFIEVSHYQRKNKKWYWQVLHKRKVNIEKPLPDLFQDVGIVYREWVESNN